MVTLRSFDKSISSAILYLYSATAAAIGAVILAIGTTEFTPIQSMSDGLLILTMSVSGGFGVVFLMYAFRNAPASVLAPFSYFGIVAQGFMGMSQPKAAEVTLTAKVWDCAGIKSHDQRSRVLKKIDQRCEGYWVERREGRTAVLHKGKYPNEITPE